MNEYCCYLMENVTWDLVSLLKGIKLDKFKWVYKTKYASYGIFERNKAQLVAKLFSQVEGIDYNETLSPYHQNEFHFPCSFP
jgi:hypothetical protein